MQSSEIRSRFLEFFRKRGHAVIPSASLVTDDEKSVTDATLFNTAGMQPLIPYLLGKPHPAGKRLVNVQKCLRTVDIDDVGDAVHATFFEMMGNWSLGDYFKEEAIGWSYEFLTSKDEGLGLDPNRLYITVFEGDANAPRDDEAAAIWKNIFAKNGVTGERIFFMPASSNWWQAGDNGPCGPDTEMYYDITNRFGGKGITGEQFISADSNKEIVEVWNDVFMQYEKVDGKIVGKLPKPSVDTGAGLERLAMTMQGVDNIFETDLLSPIVNAASGLSSDKKGQRVIADHIRAAVFLITDGITPSNTDRGYILRRLLRRAIIHADDSQRIADVARAVIDTYQKTHGDVESQKDRILGEISAEETRFRKTLDQGVREFEKISKGNGGISGEQAFTLFSSFGLPIDIIVDLAKDKGRTVDRATFENEFRKHQELSRTGAEKKFRGGLADKSDEMVIRYHTATHLLHQALHDVLGEGTVQKGSNITSERLRFDFTHNTKMTDEEKRKVEDIVNRKIIEALPMNQVIMSREEAEKTGARHLFGEKYGDKVSIYFIGNDIQSAYSKEFCGGPHVKNTEELSGPEGKWRFRINKEEAVAQGIRRIRAVLD